MYFVSEISILKTGNFLSRFLFHFFFLLLAISFVFFGCRWLDCTKLRGEQWQVETVSVFFWCGSIVRDCVVGNE